MEQIWPQIRKKVLVRRTIECGGFAGRPRELRYVMHQQEGHWVMLRRVQGMGRVAA